MVTESNYLPEIPNVMACCVKVGAEARSPCRPSLLSAVTVWLAVELTVADSKVTATRQTSNEAGKTNEVMGAARPNNKRGNEICIDDIRADLR